MILIHLNLQANKIVSEMERKCDQKITESKEESRQYLMHVQEEHAALVCIRKIVFDHSASAYAASITLDLPSYVIIVVIYYLNLFISNILYFPMQSLILLIFLYVGE